MCTVTFVARKNGFLLAMNRDDAYSRAQTCAPEIHHHHGSAALYPSEPSGGTWIGVNDVALAFTLLNWNRPVRGPKVRSRGELIPRLVNCVHVDEVSTWLEQMSLPGMYPFRIIGFSAREQRIKEWRWDGALSSIDFAWEYRHWFSSGVSDEGALDHRSAITHRAMADPDALSIEWVRRLHRSHDSQAGPFSICVHRETGGTLSYSEVEVSPKEATMRYHISSPCRKAEFLTVGLPLREIPPPPV